MLKVAAVQMTSSTDFNANLREAERLMQEAKQRGAELILLPENFACYGGDYRELAEQQGAALQAWLQYWAKTLEVTLIGGTIPLAQRTDGTDVRGGRVRSACLMYSAQGVLLGRYDKLHLFDVSVDDAQGRYCESDIFEPGDRLLVRTAGPLNIGLAVCYDLRFSLLAGALAQAGANLLVYPSAFTEVTGAAHWHLLLRARAVETGCYVLAANQCGQHSAKRKSYGHSMLIDPWGTVVAELDNAPGVLVSEIDLERQKNIRNKLPLHQHQRLTVELPNDIRFDK
jgi:deaminated glutathione amidase